MFGDFDFKNVDMSDLKTPSDVILPKKPTLKISEEKCDEVNLKSYYDALAQFSKQAYLRQMVSDFCQDGILPHVPKDAKLRDLLERQANQVMTKPPYIFITINPKEDDLKDLQKVVAKILKKKTISDYHYVYEVRKEDKGLHVHMLVKYNDKPYSFKRGIKNTCKHICQSNNPNILNFKFIDATNVNDKINYMNGVKKDSKMPGVVASVAYREKNDLKPYYTNIQPLTPITLVGVSKNVVELPSVSAE